eukprot:361252-Chlamydomonas_euryale.AAC.6
MQLNPVVWQQTWLHAWWQVRRHARWHVPRSMHGMPPDACWACHPRWHACGGMQSGMQIPCAVADMMTCT